MKRTVLLAPVIALGAIPAMAQPTITTADAPAVGQTLTYIIGNYSAITGSGENISWDLTDAGDAGPIQQTFVAPGSTPQGSEFPDADLAVVVPNVAQYIRLDGTGMYIIGVYQAANDLVVHYSDEYLAIPFPCTYGTSFHDPIVSNYMVNATEVTSTGDVSLAADGYGSLVLPWGTLDNVLKMVGVEETHDLYDGSDYHSFSNLVYFYRPGLPFYALKTLDYALDVDGEPFQSFQAMNYISQNSVGVREAMAQEIGIDVFPVPAHGLLNVVYGLGGGRTADLSLFDATGKMVRTARTDTQASGIQQHQLDVEGLPTGVYLLQLVDDRGQRGTHRVVIE